MLGGWRFLSRKLHKLEVEPKRERCSGSPTGVVAKYSRRSYSRAKSFVEVLISKTVSRGAKVRIEVEENEVGDRLGNLDYCLVGWWRGGSNPSPDLKTVKTSKIFLWNLEGSLKVVPMGRELLLLEFHSPKEAKRVLKTGKMIFKGNTSS